MDAFFNFASNHPFTAWCMAWGLWPICWMIREISISVLTAPFRYGYHAYIRRLRSRNIRLHGWPTARHMDADGDIVHPPEGRRNG